MDARDAIKTMRGLHGTLPLPIIDAIVEDLQELYARRLVTCQPMMPNLRTLLEQLVEYVKRPAVWNKQYDRFFANTDPELVIAKLLQQHVVLVQVQTNEYRMATAEDKFFLEADQSVCTHSHTKDSVEELGLVGVLYGKLYPLICTDCGALFNATTQEWVPRSKE